MNWDVTGDGKTSLKAFFGIFGDTMGADFAADLQPECRGHDQVPMERPLHGDRRSRMFPSIFPTPAATTCREASISVRPARGITSARPAAPTALPIRTSSKTRITRPRCGSTGNWWRTSASDSATSTTGTPTGTAPSAENTVDGVNVGRPYAVWNVPVVLTDPFDGQPVTLYTYPASYAGRRVQSEQGAQRAE